MEEINEKLEDVQETVNSIHRYIVTDKINLCNRKADRLKLAKAILQTVALGTMTILSVIGLIALFGVVR